jgi:hypothetical protein
MSTIINQVVFHKIKKNRLLLCIVMNGVLNTKSNVAKKCILFITQDINKSKDYN